MTSTGPSEKRGPGQLPRLPFPRFGPSRPCELSLAHVAFALITVHVGVYVTDAPIDLLSKYRSLTLDAPMNSESKNSKKSVNLDSVEMHCK